MTYILSPNLSFLFKRNQLIRIEKKSSLPPLQIDIENLLYIILLNQKIMMSIATNVYKIPSYKSNFQESKNGNYKNKFISLRDSLKFEFGGKKIEINERCWGGMQVWWFLLIFGDWRFMKKKFVFKFFELTYQEYLNGHFR